MWRGQRLARTLAASDSDSVCANCSAGSSVLFGPLRMFRWSKTALKKTAFSARDLFAQRKALDALVGAITQDIPCTTGSDAGAGATTALQTAGQTLFIKPPIRP